MKPWHDSSAQALGTGVAIKYTETHKKIPTESLVDVGWGFSEWYQ
jgi:hypothetical protein